MNIQTNQFFQLLSDDTRLRSLLLMLQEGELCVCELTHALGQSQPKVSRHLATLRDAGIVTDRRQGQWIYYQINPALPAWAREILTSTARASELNEDFIASCAALAAMPNRPGAVCCN